MNPLLLVAALLTTTSIVKADNIAVCITGQTGRMLPHLLKPFFEHNPEHTFSLFYVLQKAKDPSTVIYNTSKTQVFDPSKYAFMNDEEVMQSLENIYKPFSNVRIVNHIIRFPTSEEEFKQDFGGVEQLNVIAHFVSCQSSILNMYKNHVLCATMAEEDGLKNHYDYLITLREDAFFFKPLLLSKILPKLQNGCDFLAKRCLAFGGVNMRINVMRFAFGINYVKNRINHYRSLLNVDQRKPSKMLKNNPEQLDKLHLQSLAARICPLSIEEIPSTAARHTKDDNFCFIKFEYENCIPKGVNIDDLKCLDS